MRLLRRTILDQHQLPGVIETFGQRTYSIYWPVVTQLKKEVPFCILVSLVMISLNRAVLDQHKLPGVKKTSG